MSPGYLLPRLGIAAVEHRRPKQMGPGAVSLRVQLLESLSLRESHWIASFEALRAK